MIHPSTGSGEATNRMDHHHHISSSGSRSNSVSSTSLSSRPHWRPLPSLLIDHIAIILNSVMPFRVPSKHVAKSDTTSYRNRRPLPELIYFIHKITYYAGINCRTAIVALIYLERAKAAMPKNAIGSYDTCHRLLLGAILVASKVLQDTTWAPPFTYSNAQTDASPILLAAPRSRYYGYTNHFYVGPLTNGRLCDMCGGLYTLDEINLLERAFLKLIQYQCWVDDEQVNEYIRRNRQDLGV